MLCVSFIFLTILLVLIGWVLDEYLWPPSGAESDKFLTPISKHALILMKILEYLGQKYRFLPKRKVMLS